MKLIFQIISSFSCMFSVLVQRRAASMGSAWSLSPPWPQTQRPPLLCEPPLPCLPQSTSSSTPPMLPVPMECPPLLQHPASLVPQQQTRRTVPSPALSTAVLPPLALPPPTAQVVEALLPACWGSWVEPQASLCCCCILAVAVIAACFTNCQTICSQA